MLKIIIEYKGKIIKKKLHDECEKLTVIRVLITDKSIKNNCNHHFICDTKTGRITIPSTSCENGFKESSHLIINFGDIKFDIPIHSIYTLG